MQSSLDQRILFYKANTTTWTDYSIQLNDWNNGKTVSLSMDPGDYLYISSFLPFNHKHFKLATPAVTARSPYIETNDLAQWFPVADQLDHTSGMTASGVIQFTRDRDGRWGRATNNKRNIPVMSGAPTQVYDSFWTRISFPAGAISFTASYIGQCFSSDTDLYAEYPALRNTGLLNAWQTGKADWNDQHLLSACYITKVLRQKNIIQSNEQLLDLATLKTPSVHKTAQIIFSGLGAKNYASDIAAAQKAFEDSLVMGKFQVDADRDGIKGPIDRTSTTLRMTRG
jgi:hypothetical protein